jgi:sporulation protein YunB
MHYHKHQPFSYVTSTEPQPKNRSSYAIPVLISLLIITSFIAAVIIFFKDISTQIAVSDASDIVTAQVNQIVADIMAEQDYSADYFISLEKNESGEITAINSNMARINALSAEILTRVIGVTESRVIEVGIPAGNLSGISMLMGRGPDVTVDIVMLTSSRVEFNNTIVTAGINQTKHQINLDITVDVDVLVPWGMESNQVVTEILIADTTIVGQVPETYLNVQ